MGPNKMEKKLFEVTGSFEEMAQSQGERFRDLFFPMLADLKEMPVVASWIHKLIPLPLFVWLLGFEGKKFLQAHRPVLENFHGHNLVAQLEALSRGFGQSIERIYGFLAFEALSSQLPYSLGCSSLAFSASQTQRGEPLLAYNHDFPECFGKYVCVRKSLPKDGYASLNVTYPPMLGAIAGVNQKGLCVSLNHAYATDVHKGPALPVTLLVQQVLHFCDHVSEAVDFILKTPVPNGSFITLLDGAGNRAVVEMSGKQKQVRHVQEGMLHTFNKYQLEPMTSFEIPLEAEGKGIYKGYKIHHHNICRERRFQGIFDVTKKYSEEDIHAFMSDHDGGTGDFGTICRHHPGTASTLASVLLFPKTQSLKIIFGKACDGSYEEMFL
ncbi:MAG: hypothetical protein A2048_10405 [Deltaproteobacteria bacterium GWA2_45_12]|nr:MAG: hypothetical protein A2048_10405 [Deltaproteobacteria bacterium GWA2_45_12]